MQSPCGQITLKELLVTRLVMVSRGVGTWMCKHWCANTITVVFILSPPLISPVIQLSTNPALTTDSCPLVIIIQCCVRSREDASACVVRNIRALGVFLSPFVPPFPSLKKGKKFYFLFSWNFRALPVVPAANLQWVSGARGWAWFVAQFFFLFFFQWQRMLQGLVNLIIFFNVASELTFCSTTTVGELSLSFSGWFDH